MMKRISLVTAMICVALPSPIVPFAFAQGAPTPAECRPIAPDNLEACCTAPNWRTLVLQEDRHFCLPRASDEDQRRRVDVAETDNDMKHKKHLGGVVDRVRGLLDR
jgi:hypothetical protein